MYQNFTNSVANLRNGRLSVFPFFYSLKHIPTNILSLLLTKVDNRYKCLFTSRRRPYFLQHVHLLLHGSEPPQYHWQSSICSPLFGRYNTSPPTHTQNYSAHSSLLGGIVASLTSMAYSHFVTHQDRPAHGASGMCLLQICVYFFHW